MDEIDAALDFKNVSIVANYIKVKAELDFVYKIEAAIRFLNAFFSTNYVKVMVEVEYCNVYQTILALISIL